MRRRGSEAGACSRRFVIIGLTALVSSCSRFEGIESMDTSVQASASTPAVSSSAPAPLPPLDTEALLADATGDAQGLQRIGEAFLRPDVDAVALTRSMQPRPDDYAKVFEEPVVKKAQAGYAVFWQKGSPVRAWPEHKAVRVYAATPQDFAENSPAAEVFPQAYRLVAPSLKADVRTFALQFESPKGARALTYDGFVYVGDHWAYFPKPFRIIREGD